MQLSNKSTFLHQSEYMRKGKGETIALNQVITEKIDTGNIGNLILKRPVGKKIQCLKTFFTF